jgi:hypothetical protein
MHPGWCAASSTRQPLTARPVDLHPVLQRTTSAGAACARRSSTSASARSAGRCCRHPRVSLVWGPCGDGGAPVSLSCRTGRILAHNPAALTPNQTHRLAAQGQHRAVEHHSAALPTARRGRAAALAPRPACGSSARQQQPRTQHDRGSSVSGGPQPRGAAAACGHNTRLCSTRHGGCQHARDGSCRAGRCSKCRWRAVAAGAAPGLQAAQVGAGLSPL